MKKKIIAAILLPLITVFSCTKETSKIQENQDEQLITLSSNQNYNAIDSFIQKTITNNNPLRLDYFSTVISLNNPQFNKSSMKEIKVTNTSTNKKSIAYIDETRLISPLNYHLIPNLVEYIDNNNLQTLGAVYDGYVLFNDGCFYYGTTIVGNDGSSVFIMADWTNMIGLQPICTDIDMDTLC